MQPHSCPTSLQWSTTGCVETPHQLTTCTALRRPTPTPRCRTASRRSSQRQSRCHRRLGRTLTRPRARPLSLRRCVRSRRRPQGLRERRLETPGLVFAGPPPPRPPHRNNRISSWRTGVTVVGKRRRHGARERCRRHQHGMARSAPQRHETRHGRWRNPCCTRAARDNDARRRADVSRPETEASDREARKGRCGAVETAHKAYHGR